MLSWRISVQDSKTLSKYSLSPLLLRNVQLEVWGQGVSVLLASSLRYSDLLPKLRCICLINLVSSIGEVAILLLDL